MKRLWKIFSILILCVSVLLVALGCSKGDKGWKASAAFDINSIPVIEFATEQRIMVLSDLGLNIDTPEDNRLTYNMLASTVSIMNPDLLIFNGDMVRCGKGGRNLETFREFVAKVEELQKPWTFVFGDDDGVGKAKTSELVKEVAEAKYCIFKPTTDKIEGVSNQIIMFKNLEGTLLRSLVLLDSNGKYDKKGTPNFIYKSQVDWFSYQMNEINKYAKENNKGNTTGDGAVGDEGGEQQRVVNTLISHVPLQETMTAYNGGAILSGERREQGSIQPKNAGLFDQMFGTYSTTDYLFAHNRENDFVTIYETIKFTSCMRSGYINKELNPNQKELPNGVTTMYLNRNGFFNVEQLWYR